MDRSLTVVIACHNESENLESTVKSALSALRSSRITDYEIIIVDDHSSDHTGVVANKLASRLPCTTVIHNENNQGFGSSFLHGRERSSKRHLTVLPGDNEICEKSVAAVFAATGRADIVTAYPLNREVRPLVRRCLSRGFVALMNMLSGYRLRYYNGPNIYRTADIRTLEFTTTGFTFNALAVIQLMRRGKKVAEVPMETRSQKTWKTSALRPKNVYAVLKDILRYVQSPYFRSAVK